MEKDGEEPGARWSRWVVPPLLRCELPSLEEDQSGARRKKHDEMHAASSFALVLFAVR